MDFETGGICDGGNRLVSCEQHNSCFRCYGGKNTCNVREFRNMSAVREVTKLEYAMEVTIAYTLREVKKLCQL